MLSTKMIVWGAVLVVLVGVGTVVLGVGGGIALLLAARRQRSTEFDLLHTVCGSSRPYAGEKSHKWRS